MRARELFEQYAQDKRALLSTHVVQEFYATRSRKPGIPRRELLDATAGLLDASPIVVGPAEIRSAIEKEERYKFLSGTP